MSTSLVLTEHSGDVSTITLNRPDKRNALSPDMLKGLRTAFAEVRTSATKVVVLRGAGKVFCAGADLAYLQQLSEFSILENKEDSTLLQEVFHEVYTCPKPTIAAVHGAAIAGGCGLASVCDFVVADVDNALFGYSEVKIGFIPAVVMVYLQRKIGDAKTRDLVLSARNISATEALELGLVSRVAVSGQFEEEVSRLTQQLAGNSSSAMALTKEMLRNLQGMSLDDGLRYASSMNALARMTDDCQNGIAKFLNKS